MKWITSFTALAFAGLMTSAAACITPADIDYAAMSMSDLEDSCAAAMAQSQETAPGESEDVNINAGAMEACTVLQKRRDAEGY